MKKLLIAALVMAAAPGAAQAGTGSVTCWTAFPGLGWLNHLFEIQCDAINNPGGGISR